MYIFQGPLATLGRPKDVMRTSIITNVTSGYVVCLVLRTSLTQSFLRPHDLTFEVEMTSLWSKWPNFCFPDNQTFDVEMTKLVICIYPTFNHRTDTNLLSLYCYPYPVPLQKREKETDNNMTVLLLHYF